MKHFFITCAIVLGTISAMASHLVITTHTSTNIAQDIAIIGKWVFVDNYLQLLDKEGNIIAVEPTNNIRKITFAKEIETSVEETVTQDILIYPNPTHDILIIKGIDAQPIRVYNMQGNVVLHKYGTEINVESLTNGTYLLQVGAQVVRFIKQ